MNYHSSTVRSVITIDDLLLNTIEQPTFFASTDHRKLQQLPAHILPGEWKNTNLGAHAVSPILHTLPYDPGEAMTLSVWHHGAAYRAVLCGRPEVIVTYSDYGDSQRETYMLAAMKQYAAGREVLSIATTLLSNPLNTWRDVHATKRSWEIIGNMAAARTPRGATASMLQNKPPVTVIGTADPRYIAAVCQKIGINSAAQTPIDASTMVGLEHDMLTKATVIGNITPHTQQQIGTAIARPGTHMSPSAVQLLGLS